MSFTSPLWLLLLGLVPVVVILHAIAVRWRSSPVSSLVFWNEVLRDRKASLRIRRLLSSLSLLLEVLAVAALAVGLAGPRLARGGLSGAGDTILVLDATASMQTREGARTRFELARSRGLDLVAGMRRGARMAVILAERSPRLAVAFTDDRAALRRALQAASATDEPGDVGDSMVFALTLRNARRGDQVVLLTDGAFETLAGVDETLPWIHVLTVGARQSTEAQSARPGGAPRDNIGITGLAFRRTAGGEAAYELFVAVRNSGGRSVSVPLTVTVDRTPVVSRTLTLAAGERTTLSIPWTGPTAGRVEARLRTGDDFPVDDQAYAVFTPARSVRALVVGPDTYFVQKALESLPGVTVSTADNAPSGDFTAEEKSKYDVVVYENAQPPALDAGNVILFSALPPNLPIRATGRLDLPQVTGWDRTDPLLEAVPLGGVTIGTALSLQPGSGFTVLASSRGSPLVLTWDQSGLKALIVAFDPQQTDLPLRPGFPVFLANALSWFFPSWLAVQAEQVQAGNGRALPTQGAAAISVMKPDGMQVTLNAAGPSVEFYDTDETGFYRVESGGSASEFAVSLVSESETDITPRFAAPGQAAATTTVASSAGRVPALPAGVPTPIWGALAAAAFALIVAEWLAWLRPTEAQSARPGGARQSTEAQSARPGGKP